MAPSGPRKPSSGSETVSPSLLPCDVGYMGSQHSPMNSQMGFSMQNSNRVDMLGNGPNAPYMLNRSFGDGGSGMSHRASINSGAESDKVSNRMGFVPSSFISADAGNSSTSNQVQGQSFQRSSSNQMSDQHQQYQQPQRQDYQSFQHSQQPSLQVFSATHYGHRPDLQQSYQMNIDVVRPVNFDQKASSNFHGQALRNDIVKVEPQMQSMRGRTPVKGEPHDSDRSLFIQQQPLLHLSGQHPRTSSVAQTSIMNQHQLIQLQEHQQQQLLGAMAKQQMLQSRQQFPTTNFSLRAPGRPPYEPGTCARRLTQYMYQQQNRPQDNNIEFWREFVAEYFTLHARKKWCVSMYGSGRQTSGVFPQDVWHCEICNHKASRGFEATAVGLPRLFKMKYESGTLEELLYVDMPREYQNSSGQIVLDYAKAIQESVFDQLRVVRDGQLRIVFSANLKICSWEFCAWRHEELIPRRILSPQISHLGAAAQNYQAASQKANSNLSAPELENNCNMFVTSARNLAKVLEVPLVNDLGYTKRYVRCLQITEVVNSMIDLIDYSRETRTGPMESLVKFPRRMKSPPQCNGPSQHDEDGQPPQQQRVQPNTTALSNSTSDQGLQHTSNNGVLSAVNTISLPTSLNTGSGFVHQISVNSVQQNTLSNAHSSYGASSHQAVGPSNTVALVHSTVAPSHTNGIITESSTPPFNSPVAPSSDNIQPMSYSVTAPAAAGSENSPGNISMQHPVIPTEADQNESQSSVHKIIQEMIMSSQLSNGGNSSNGLFGGICGNELRNISRSLPVTNGNLYNGGSSMPEVGIANNGGLSSSMVSSGLTQSSLVTGLGNTMSNSVSTNGRMGMASLARDQLANQPLNMGTQLLSGLSPTGSVSNSQFDWKISS